MLLTEMYQIAMEIIIPTVRPFIDRNAGKIPALGIPDFLRKSRILRRSGGWEQSDETC